MKKNKKQKEEEKIIIILVSRAFNAPFSLSIYIYIVFQNTKHPPCTGDHCTYVITTAFAFGVKLQTFRNNNNNINNINNVHEREFE
jgi:hypothetical protein